MTITTLGELRTRGLLDFNDGYRTKKDQLAASGFRIIRAGDINNGEVSPTGPDHVAEAYASAIGQKVLHDNDVVLTTKGTIGRTALVRDATGHEIYSPQLCFFRPDSSVLLAKYLYFWLSGPEFTYQSSFMKNSTDMAPYISLSQLSDTRITLPPLPEQQAIAEVLGALDDKIAANRKLVTTINKLASVEYKKSAVTERTLTDLASFVNGRNFTKNATGDGRVVVRIAELNSGIGGSTVRNQVEDAADDNLVRPGDILFAWSGSLTVHRWTQPEALINQHIFKVIPNDDVPYWLAYQAVKEKLPEFKSIAADKATTMGHIQRRHLDTAVMVPSPDKISEIDPLMSSLWKRAITADEESRTLASLRDTLLPALMDGTIRVKDAEKQTEEVL